MDIVSWMYVSKSLIAPERGADVLDDIVAVARRRNQELDVTGCLIFARNRFAQILEGPIGALTQLKKDIEADGRHADLVAIEVPSQNARRFSGWSLTYAGPSCFVERMMEEAITKAALRDREAIKDLLEMMEQFASPIPPIAESR